MTRGQTLLLLGFVAVGGLTVLLLRPRGGPYDSIVNPQMDPDMGRHRGRPYILAPESGIGAPLRFPSAQDPKPSADRAGYPYAGDRFPGAYAQGFPKGYGDGPLGYTPLDYGKAPQRIPRLWKDYTRYWDGVMQHGAVQQNSRAFFFHLRPSMPTRGFRSVSGVLYNGGPTASRARVPAVYVPSVVA